MIAKVTTYGGNNHDTQHWQLHVDGRFVADSSLEVDRDLYEEIAAILNAAHREPREVERVGTKWVLA